jgi:hypothetical protein
VAGERPAAAVADRMGDRAAEGAVISVPHGEEARKRRLEP